MMMKWLNDDVITRDSSSVPAPTIICSKIMIFLVFYESVTDQWTDRPTDGPTDMPGYRDARTHQKSVVRLSNLEYHELPVRDIGALWPISSSAPFSASWTRQKISIGQPWDWYWDLVQIWITLCSFREKSTASNESPLYTLRMSEKKSKIHREYTFLWKYRNASKSAMDIIDWSYPKYRLYSTIIKINP